MSTPFTFLLPIELSAKEPPERRGIARDGVRLMMINRKSGEVEHSRFNGISEFLHPGDLLIFNPHSAPFQLLSKVAMALLVNVWKSA